MKKLGILAGATAALMALTLTPAQAASGTIKGSALLAGQGVTAKKFLQDDCARTTYTDANVNGLDGAIVSVSGMGTLLKKLTWNAPVAPDANPYGRMTVRFLTGACAGVTDPFNKINYAPGSSTIKVPGAAVWMLLEPTGTANLTWSFV